MIPRIAKEHLKKHFRTEVLLQRVGCSGPRRREVVGRGLGDGCRRQLKLRVALLSGAAQQSPKRLFHDRSRRHQSIHFLGGILVISPSRANLCSGLIQPRAGLRKGLKDVCFGDYFDGGSTTAHGVGDAWVFPVEALEDGRRRCFPRASGAPPWGELSPIVISCAVLRIEH